MLGQMMEAVEFPAEVPLRKLPPKDWALTGAKGRPSRFGKKGAPPPLTSSVPVARLRRMTFRQHSRLDGAVTVRKDR
jgi:hypothetical protein